MLQEGAWKYSSTLYRVGIPSTESDFEMMEVKYVNCTGAVISLLAHSAAVLLPFEQQDGNCNLRIVCFGGLLLSRMEATDEIIEIKRFQTRTGRKKGRPKYQAKIYLGKQADVSENDPLFVHAVRQGGDIPSAHFGHTLTSL